jgi:hypothetical protein
MNACANYVPTGGCKAIVFNANLTLTHPYGGNCWFKAGTTSTTQGDEAGTDAAAFVSGITVS